MTEIQLTFSLDDYIGQRLDKALSDAHPDISRAQWQRLIKEGQVMINGRSTKVSLKVEGNEKIIATIPAPEMSELLAQDIPLDIRYEDEDLLLINKPAGMVVHPAAGHEDGTLVNAVLAHCPDLPGIGGEVRPGIVHRLDKNTSGLILVAKNELSLRHLQAQFKERTVEKRYLALVEGQTIPAQALIDAPIGRDPRQRKKMAVLAGQSARNRSKKARSAQTEYHTLISYDDYTLLECVLHTGRTHQIRVHLAYIGHPIVGDTVYGRRKAEFQLKRQFLHAANLTFKRPSDNELLTFRAELPPELETVLQILDSTP